MLGLSDGGKVVPREWGQRRVPKEERAHKGHNCIHLFVQEILTGQARWVPAMDLGCADALVSCAGRTLPSYLRLSLAAAAQVLWEPKEGPLAQTRCGGPRGFSEEVTS